MSIQVLNSNVQEVLAIVEEMFGLWAYVKGINNEGGPCTWIYLEGTFTQAEMNALAATRKVQNIVM